jgi:hypothetical protein
VQRKRWVGSLKAKDVVEKSLTSFRIYATSIRYHNSYSSKTPSVMLINFSTHQAYPDKLRLVKVIVLETNRRFVFLTDSFTIPFYSRSRTLSRPLEGGTLLPLTQRTTC